jgi:hypothetical protein
LFFIFLLFLHSHDLILQFALYMGEVPWLGKSCG